MFYKRIYIIILLILPLLGLTQQTDSIHIKKILNEVNINALTDIKTTPIAFTNISKKEITEVNLGLDLPYIVTLTPSLVTTSDAGNGVGYTGLRIRGTDPTRINVTLNGIPLNDSESQGLWWVNMPDLASSLENIQIQRGVGGSTNGGSAFGASINLNTTKVNKNYYVRTNNTFGSFNTIKNNIELGTGLINNKLSVDLRLSKIISDGYIDRSSSNLKSLYLSANYIGKNEMLKGLIIAGNERTYQAWYGVPINYLDNHRTYNPYDYDSEVDNYKQTHYQLHYNKVINQNTDLNLSAHYTHGEGYYEQYIGDKNNLNLYYNTYLPDGENLLSYYSLDDVIINNDTIKSSNIVRRKWLNNDFGGFTFSLNHRTKKTNLILGGAGNRYSGQHFGRVIWIENISLNHVDYEYYKNIATKDSYNIFLKTDYFISKTTNLYIDLQSRAIDYKFLGKNEQGNSSEQKVSLDFFNPKIGIHSNLNLDQSIYFSFAIGNKEPNRNDYVESTPNSRPLHETLYDFELGYKFSNKKIMFGANAYLMEYKNQLIPTGKINDVGAYTRVNIEKSFRRGLELQGRVKIGKLLEWSSNMTLSQNKLESFIEYIDNWDTFTQEKVEHQNTNLAFSPSIIWSSNFKIKISDNADINIITKYIGDQFIDNTSSLDSKMDDYLTNTCRVTYNIRNKWLRTARLTLQVNNILNNEYISNAWVYRFISDSWDPRGSNPYVNKNNERGYNMSGFFPEAKRNYLLGLSIGL